MLGPTEHGNEWWLIERRLDYLIEGKLLHDVREINMQFAEVYG